MKDNRAQACLQAGWGAVGGTHYVPVRLRGRVAFVRKLAVQYMQLIGLAAGPIVMMGTDAYKVAWGLLGVSNTQYTASVSYYKRTRPL